LRDLAGFRESLQHRQKSGIKTITLHFKA
jgi:hypothetical protein